MAFSFKFCTTKREEERSGWALGRQFQTGCGFLRSGSLSSAGWGAPWVWNPTPAGPFSTSSPTEGICVCGRGEGWLLMLLNVP